MTGITAIALFQEHLQYWKIHFRGEYLESMIKMHLFWINEVKTILTLFLFVSILYLIFTGLINGLKKEAKSYLPCSHLGRPFCNRNAFHSLYSDHGYKSNHFILGNNDLLGSFNSFNR